MLASAGVAALSEALPAARLSYLVGPWSLEVARRGPPLNELLTCDFPGFTRRPKGSPWSPYQELARQALRLRSHRYDLAVILRPDHWWGALLAMCAGIPRRLGYAVPLTQPLLTNALPLPPRAHNAELGLTLAAAAAALARESGGDLAEADAFASHHPVVFRLFDDDEREAERLLERHGLGTRPLLVVHPGSGSPLKGWPAERWAEAADALADRLGAYVLLSGGSGEQSLVLEVAAGMARPAEVLAGEASLGALGAILRRAKLVLGADSGPLHLATAVGAPTLRLYGPTDTAHFGPWGSESRHRLARIHLPCSPCGNLVNPPCGASATPACMTGIAVSQVLSEQTLLAAGG